MSSLFAHPDFPELSLSSLPAERQVQVRVLDDVLSVIESRQRNRVMPAWGALPHFSETAAVVEATERHMAIVPVDAGFGSFEDLKSRRDETGVVRLR